MKEVLVSFLLICGGAFSLLAAIGMVRMPDLFTRMQAATKAGTFGAGFALLAVAVHFGQLGVTTHALLVIAFLFLTAPVAAHVIARAGYFLGVAQWEGTVLDELQQDLGRDGTVENDSNCRRTGTIVENNTQSSATDGSNDK